MVLKEIKVEIFIKKNRDNRKQCLVSTTVLSFDTVVLNMTGVGFVIVMVDAHDRVFI